MIIDDYWYLEETSTGIKPTVEELHLNLVRWCKFLEEDSSWVAEAETCSNDMLANVARATNDEDPAPLRVLILCCYHIRPLSSECLTTLCML